MSATSPDKDGVTAANIARDATNKELEAAGFTDRNIFRELAIIGFCDLRKFLDDGGNIKNLTEVSPLKVSKAVKKIKVTKQLNTVTGIETVRTEYELHDKLQALNMAILIKGLKSSEKVEFPDENGKPQRIGGEFSETERAARLIFLLDKARKQEAQS